MSGPESKSKGSASDRARAAGGAAKRARSIGQGASERSDSRVRVTDVTAPGALDTMSSAATEAKSLGNRGLDLAMGSRNLTTIDTRRKSLDITRPVSNAGIGASMLGAGLGVTGLGSLVGALDTEAGVFGRTDVTLSTNLDPTKNTAANPEQRGLRGQRKDPATTQTAAPQTTAPITPANPDTGALSASADRRRQRRNRPPSLFGPASLSAASLFGV